MKRIGRPKRMRIKDRPAHVDDRLTHWLLDDPHVLRLQTVYGSLGVGGKEVSFPLSTPNC